MTVEQEIRFLVAKMGVRYFQDCSYSTDGGKTWIDSEEDTDEEGDRFRAAIPLVQEEVREYKGLYGGMRKEICHYWAITIDLNEGKVLDWPEGFAIRTNFKVCDDGEYLFFDADKNLITNITDEYDQYYVPDFLSIEDEGYGDYVYINIGPDGKIEHFDRMMREITDWFSRRDDD